jgi:ribonuclease-3
VTPLEQVEAAAGHTFGDRSLLTDALTHRSYARERATPVARNERLEFLGDAVLYLVVAGLLLERLPQAPEGRLTTLRAAVVNERSLAAVARALGLGHALRLGRGEERSGGRDKDSILAGAYEALVGAVFLDGGWAEAADRVRDHLAGPLDEAIAGRTEADHKTRLQELVQARGAPVPRYALTATEGPDHARTFHVEVSVGGAVVGRGRGRSKKEAEQRAAAEAVAGLSEVDPDTPDDRR